MSTAESSVYDWTAPGVFVNPHPLLHEMRMRTPVYFDPTLEAWVLTRYRDVRQALQDPRFGRVEQFKRFAALPEVDQEALAPLRRVFPVWGGQGEPPEDHRLFVDLLRPVLLSPQAKGSEDREPVALIPAMRPRMEATLDRLLEAVLKRERFDMVGDVARPFAMQAIADLLGVPTTGHMEMLLRCARVVPGMFEQGTRGQLYSCQECVLELRDYVEPIVAAHHTQRQADLISLFLEAGEAHFDHDYVVAQTVLLLVVGSYPPGNLLASGLQLLFEYPEQRAKLRADPSLIGNAIDEMVRFSPPVPPFSTRELAKEDVSIGNQLIHRGESVVVVLGAANRDPDVFHDPDQFDVSRKNVHRHMGFGIAPHACLGREFVHTAGEVFFPTILERLPDLRPIDAEPDWVPFRPFGRELRTLRVSVT